MSPKLPVALAAGLAIAACGGSDPAQDKDQGQGQGQGQTPTQAQAQVCSARADIRTQIGELKGMTASTVTLRGVTTSLATMADAVERIAAAQDDLAPARKQQIQAANSAFKSDLSGLGGDLLKSVRSGQVRSQLHASAQQLEQSYRKALAPIKCT
jgi:hypothetical protein